MILLVTALIELVDVALDHLLRQPGGKVFEADPVLATRPFVGVGRHDGSLLAVNDS